MDRTPVGFKGWFSAARARGDEGEPWAEAPGPISRLGGAVLIRMPSRSMPKGGKSVSFSDHGGKEIVKADGHKLTLPHPDWLGALV